MFKDEFIPGWQVTRTIDPEIYNVAHECPKYGGLTLYKVNKHWSKKIGCACGAELPENIITTLILNESL